VRKIVVLSALALWVFAALGEQPSRPPETGPGGYEIGKPLPPKAQDLQKSARQAAPIPYTSTRVKRLALSVTLCLAAIGPSAGLSIEPRECPAIDSPSPASAPYCPAVDPVGRASLRVFLDRRTGRLRAPTPEEARALFEARGRGVEYLEPLEVVRHPDGMRSVNLKGAFASQIVAHKNPDGSVSTRCVPAGAEDK